MTSAVVPQTLEPQVEVRQVELGKSKSLLYQVYRLVRALVPGVPVDVAHGGYLIEELEFVNHRDVKHHAEIIAKQVVADMVTGRALVFNTIFFRKFEASAFPR